MTEYALPHGRATAPSPTAGAKISNRLDRTQREESINDYVKAFEQETKRPDDHFDHHKSTVADVDSVMQLARFTPEHREK